MKSQTRLLTHRLEMASSKRSYPVKLTLNSPWVFPLSSGVLPPFCSQVPGVAPVPLGGVPGLPSVHVPTCTWSLPLPALCTQFGRASRSSSLNDSKCASEPGVSAGRGKNVGQSPRRKVVNPTLSATEPTIASQRTAVTHVLWLLVNSHHVLKSMLP